MCCCADLLKEKKNRRFLGSKESEEEVKVFLRLLERQKDTDCRDSREKIEKVINSSYACKKCFGKLSRVLQLEKEILCDLDKVIDKICSVDVVPGTKRSAPHRTGSSPSKRRRLFGPRHNLEKSSPGVCVSNYVSSK